MDNQHQKITGYRELDQVEIDLMNEVKAHAEATRQLVLRVENAVLDRAAQHGSLSEPMSWLVRGRTDLQVGYMKLVRAIARPTTF